MRKVLYISGPMSNKSEKSVKPTTFSAKVDLSIADKLHADLRNQGFEISTPQYTVFSGKKKGVSCTLYKSGKLLVQGKEASSFIEFYLEPEILGSFTYSYSDMGIDRSARIGIDESGKGDFFGPLCVAGVYASSDEILMLKEIGVRDSKTMNDKAILKLADKIKLKFSHHVVRINPLKYNELYSKFGNLNHLLAWGHATAIESLVKKTGCTNVLIDQFAAETVVEKALHRKGLDVQLSQRHRGEEDVVVAAASILSRQAFLQGIERLEKEYSLILPKGASAATIAAGRKFLGKYGRQGLDNVCKLHFKTLDAILRQHPE